MICGKCRTGKSHLFEDLIESLIANGDQACVLNRVGGPR